LWKPVRYNVFSGQQSERRAFGGAGVFPLSEEKGLKMKIAMMRKGFDGHAVKAGI